MALIYDQIHPEPNETIVLLQSLLVMCVCVHVFGRGSMQN